MKKLFNWAITKIKEFLRWIWQECKDWRTIVLLSVVILIVYSPVWGGYLLFWIFRWKWALILATACLAFWAGPFSPFFVLCVSITLGLKKLFRRLRKKDKGEDELTEDGNERTAEPKTKDKPSKKKKKKKANAEE